MDLKFQHIDIHNFKNIEQRTVDINGRSFLIMGKNGSGKSSFIQALLSPLDTKVIASMPVKDGEEQAKIEVVLSGDVNGKRTKYSLEMYFSAKTNKGRLVVYNETGEKISAPSTFVKSLIGDISFDIMEFVNAPKSHKINTLRMLSGKDREITLIEREIKEVKDGLQYLKKREKELNAFVEEHDLSQEVIKKYEQPINVSDIHKKLEEFNKVALNYSKIKDGVSSRKMEVNLFKSKINDLEVRMREMQNEINNMNEAISLKLAEINKGEEWLENNQMPDLTSIHNELNFAIEHNSEHDKIKSVYSKHKEMVETQNNISTNEAILKKIVADRDNLIKKSKLPVKGLTWTDDEVYINGLPLESEQINKSTLFEIGADISMALNPNLKVIFLHDGSLFDKEHLKAVVKKVEEKGYQCIIEYVAENPEFEIQFLEK